MARDPVMSGTRQGANVAGSWPVTGGDSHSDSHSYWKPLLPSPTNEPNTLEPNTLEPNTLEPNTLEPNTLCSPLWRIVPFLPATFLVQPLLSRTTSP